MEFHPVLSHLFFFVKEADRLIFVFQENIVFFSALGIVFGKHAKVQNKDEDKSDTV